MTLKRLVLASALLCAIASPAFSQKTKAVLNAEVASSFPDNTVGAITPLNLRTVTSDIINSIMPTAPVVAGNLACFSGTTGLLQDCGTGPSATGIIYTPPYTGGVTETQSAYNAQRVSVMDFGATGNGSTDDTAAFTHAFAQTPPIAVDVPCGTYNVTGITITQANTVLNGRGMGCSTIRATNAATPVIAISSSLTGVSITNLTIDRTITATAGGTGIDWSTSSDQSYLGNLFIKDQYNGLILGNTGFSTAENLTISKNVNIGLLGTNGAGGSVALQWQLSNIISGQNGATGFAFSCNGTGGMSLGQHRGLATFANTGIGISYIGLSTCAINGIRLSDSFFGQDGGTGEVYLDTFASFAHTITDVSAELVGTGPTGPTLGTPASNTGAGIVVSANNPNVTLTSVTANQNSLNGLDAFGPQVTVMGGNYTNNGQAASGGSQNGVISGATTRLIAHGATIGNTGANTSQQIGVLLVSGASNGVVLGNDLRSNTSTALTNNSGNTTNITQNNLGGAAFTVTQQLQLITGTPTIASGACGTGTNGTIAGDNQAGTITIGAAATTTCTVSFSATLNAAPKACVISPDNAAAATWATTLARVSSKSTGGFVVTGSALANTTFDYHCI